jgi:DNA processing protein
MNNERHYWVAFSYVPGIGPTRARQLLEMFGSLREAWHAPAEAVAQAGIDKRALKSLHEARKRIDIGAEVARLDKLGIAVLTWEDPIYPRLLAQLRHIDHAPLVLYVRGRLSEDDHWALTVVGTRRITAYGRQVTRRIVPEVAAQGVTVVSGLARGVDGEAHQAALEAGGRTIAVLPCGLDRIYPSEHRQLAARIVQNGAIITPFPLNTRPEAGNFQPRNRVLSGMGRGVLVIEGGHKSGSLITARYALEQGRDVLAVPGSIMNRSSDGPNKLIQDGAYPILHASDIMEAMQMEYVPDYVEARQTLPEMSDAEQAVLGVLTDQPTHIDDIAQRLQLPINQVSSTLTMLVLKGVVREVDTMTYART